MLHGYRARSALEPLWSFDRSVAARGAGVEGGCRLEEHNVYLVVGVWAVFDSVRNYNHLALLQRDSAVSKSHFERTRQDKEEFVLGVVVVPLESPLELGQSDMLSVEFGDDLRVPMS